MNQFASKSEIDLPENLGMFDGISLGSSSIENPENPDSVMSRFMEVCPVKKVGDMCCEEITRDVTTAFNIVNYEPIDLATAMQKAFESNSEWLYQFVFDVWRYDQ